jgi:hypothetical protein
MRVCFFLILMSVILTSCEEEKKEQVTEPTTTFADMQLQETSMALVGKAQQEALNWKDYQDLMTAFENYDHSIAATQQMMDYTAAMSIATAQPFNDKPIASRIKILHTRLGIYKSYLGYTTRVPELRAAKYNDIITAIDELTIQMNWKANQYDERRRELLEDLEQDAEQDRIAQERKRDTIPAEN